MEEKLTDYESSFSILGNVRPGPWVDGGLCRQTDPELFFPDKGERVDSALIICGRCEVRTECLEYADELEKDLLLWQIHGVFGGLTRQERVSRREELEL